MTKADLLSRHVDHNVREGDNQDVVLLKPELFVCVTELELFDRDILTCLYKLYNLTYNYSVLLTLKQRDPG